LALDGCLPLLEALIFATPEPASEERLAAVIGEVEPADIGSLVQSLNNLYERENHAFRIVRAAGGWRFVTNQQYSRLVKQFLAGGGKIRLTRAALESLSVIAYKQPVSKTDIESVRRVDVGGVLKLLLERRLIKIVGRSKGPGRAFLYGTTTEFLKHFGLDSLEELPQIGELAAMKRSEIRTQETELFESE